MLYVGIDPGPVKTSVAVLRDDGTLESAFTRLNDGALLYCQQLENGLHVCRVAIEQVACYGLPVGQEVFSTVFWYGRFFQALRPSTDSKIAVSLITRGDVKMHLCHTLKGVNDAVVRQALIDRFGPGKDVAIGLKRSPGPLYGVTKDQWAALAVAVTLYDQTLAGVQPHAV